MTPQTVTGSASEGFGTDPDDPRGDAKNMCMQAYIHIHFIYTNMPIYVCTYVHVYIVYAITHACIYVDI